LKCPLCMLYGLDVELEELEHDGRKYYRCKQPDLHHTFCEHILNATRKDINSFSCSNCDSPINECNCFDCEVFCEQCNEFIGISCSEATEIININEEKLLKEEKQK
jgi:hypothetical protein